MTVWNFTREEKDGYNKQINEDPKSGLAKLVKEKLGFNKSAIHCDIVSTDDRTVTAFLGDGSQKIIFINSKSSW